MRVRRAGATALVTVGLLFSLPQLASADLEPPADGYEACEFSDATLSPSVLVVGTTHDRSVRVNMRSTGCGGFAVRNGDEGVVGNPYLDFGSYVGGYLYSDDGDPRDVIGWPSADPDTLDNSSAGRPLTGIITLPDGSTRDFPGPSLTLKRKTAVEARAPSKVRKNKRFYVEGGLISANWDTDEYDQATKKTVRLQARTSGGRWKTVKKQKTLDGPVEGGNLYLRVKIKKKTCFRWVYSGDRTTAPVTSSQKCVKIKK